MECSSPCCQKNSNRRNPPVNALCSTTMPGHFVFAESEKPRRQRQSKVTTVVERCRGVGCEGGCEQALNCSVATLSIEPYRPFSQFLASPCSPLFSFVFSGSDKPRRRRRRRQHRRRSQRRRREPRLPQRRRRRLPMATRRMTSRRRPGSASYVLEVSLLGVLTSF